MYPDTDLPPKRITAGRLAHIQAQLPPQVWALETWYQELGVPADLMLPLAISPWALLFEKLVKAWSIPPKLAAVVLIQYPKRLKARGLPVQRLNPAVLEQIFNALRQERITPDGLLNLMEQVLKNDNFNEKELPPLATPEELTQTIQTAVKQLETMRIYNPDQKPAITMGLVMQKLRGRSPGKVVASAIQKYFQEV
jgi:glutamyl-tRNA(Gln) amidotransferase subunit E